MNKTIFLETDKIYLRLLTLSDDLSAYERWVNDQNTTRYMGVGKFPLTVKLLKEYIEHYNASVNFLLGIFLKSNDRHVGNITLHQIDQLNRSAEIGILIGEEDVRGQGIGSMAVSLVVDHGFMRLNLNRITTGMIEGNANSEKMFARVGFIKEGTLREHFYLDGKYWDCYRYGLLRSEYKRKAL